MKCGGAENPRTIPAEIVRAGIRVYQELPDKIKGNYCGNEPRHCSDAAIASIDSTGRLRSGRTDQPAGCYAEFAKRTAVVGVVAAATLFLASRSRS